VEWVRKGLNRFIATKEKKMTRHVLKCGFAVVLLSAAGSAYAGDSSILSDARERPNQPLSRQQHVQLSAFSGAGPCQPGTVSVLFPNSQGFHCVSNQQ
jgi:hypothetical protein